MKSKIDQTTNKSVFGIFTLMLITLLGGCVSQSVRVQVFNMKNAIYCDTVKSFIIIKYAPIDLKCSANKKFASEAIGFTLPNRDTLRVLSICSYNKELITTFNQLDLEVGFKNYRDSSILKDSIYIKGIEGYSNRKLKTVFADIFVYKE